MRLRLSKCRIQFAQQMRSTHVVCVCARVYVLSWCTPEIVSSIATESKEMTSRKQKRTQIENAFNAFFILQIFFSFSQAFKQAKEYSTNKFVYFMQQLIHL